MTQHQGYKSKILPMVVGLISVASRADAFSSPSYSMEQSLAFTDDATSFNDMDGTSSMRPPTTSSMPITRTTAKTACPWRVVLDIGREPLGATGMPFDWARSGSRMPLVIPCDFNSDQLVLPKSDTVSFTTQTGGVVKPVEGGSWSLSDDQTEFTMTVSFPEQMERNDVWIDAGTTMTLQAVVYTQDKMDELNQAFYDARETVWELGEELNNIARVKESPKKWNPETERWEKKQLGLSSLANQMQKRVQLLAAQAKQAQASNQRPSPNILSDRGSLPGMERQIYIQKQGVVKIGNSVVGKWSAEPIVK